MVENHHRNRFSRKNSEFFQSFFSEQNSEKIIQRKIQREIQSSPNLPKEKGEIVGRAGFPACSC
jgi:hypothetical protein